MKQTIQFREQIAPGEKNIVFQKVLPHDGHTVQVKAYFPEGQQETLKIRPSVVKPTGSVTELLAAAEGSEAWICGDKYEYDNPAEVRFEKGDFLQIIASNESDAATPYWVRAWIVVEYQRGR